MNSQISSSISGPFWPRLSLWLAVIVLMTMPVYPFVTTWLGSYTDYDLLLKAVKDVALIATSIGLLVWLMVDSQRRRAMYGDTVLWLLLAVLVVSSLVSVLTVDSIDRSLLAGILANGRYLTIFFLVYASLRHGGARADLVGPVLKFVAWAGAVLALIGIIQVAVLPLDTLENFGYQKGETIAPYVLIDDNPDAPRAFATLRGPNDYAAYLLVSALAMIVLTVRDRRWLLGLGVLLAAMVLSSSRSAWLALAVALAFILLAIYPRLTDSMKRYARYGSYAAVVVGSLVLIAAMSVPALRLAVFHSSPDDTHLTEGSTDDHWIATGDGIDRVVDQPIGCGVGCAGPASFYSDSPRVAENYFVQIAEEIGIAGLLVWLALLGYIMWQLWLRRHNHFGLMVLASGIGLCVVGVWLHVWYDDPVSLTWWALAGLALARLQPQKQVH